MTLSVIDKALTSETLAACTMPTHKGETVILAEKRRNARRHVRLYRDKAGAPYVIDRLYGRRYIVAVRFLTIDGVPLNFGCALLAPVTE